MGTISLWVAFMAGVASFFSPCTLPLYPSYLSYITGISASQLGESNKSIRKITLLHTLCFVVGFSIVFYALGYAFSWVGSAFMEYQSVLRRIGAVILFVMGLFLMGLIRPMFLMREKKIGIFKKRWGYFGTLIIGVSFAAGWTPCLGPIFSAILTMVAYRPELAFTCITAYTLGFAVPFILMSFFVSRMSRLARHSGKVMKVGGACMVIVALLLYTNHLNMLTIWLTRWIS